MASLNSLNHLLVLLFLVLLTKSFNSNAENFNMGCIDKEREALLQFKQGLRDPSGRLSSWGVGVDCCNWLGVGCDNLTGHVSRLNLRGQYYYCSEIEESEAADYNTSCLFGTLNPSLLNLTYLNYLDLSNNNFQGIPVPEFIVSLRNLRYLNLSFVSFTGMVPSDLGNLSNLQYLGLGMYPYSSLSYSYSGLWVSDLNWLSSLYSLQYLDLRGLDLRNASTNWLQVLNMLPSLRELHLSSCKLSAFPQSVPLVNFTSLSVLDLSENDFQGIPIPNFIGSLKNLRHLDLSDASFIGMVPPSLGNLSNLQYLDLSWLSIRSLDLNWLSGLSSLQYLNLELVNLSKAMTSWQQVVNMLPMLRELYLSDCQLRNLQYSLPFINLTSLSVLDLSNNNFSSPIPRWLFNISTLTTIRLSSCELSGSIPRVTQENLCNLCNLDLSYNGISGEITEFIEALSGCNNSTLLTLEFSSNKLGGNIPVSLGHFKYLKYLRLSQNSFIGALPTFVGNLSYLVALDLAFNKMNGTIPEIVGQLTDLELLDLSGNSWEGVVTENHLQNLTRLTYLLLSFTSKSLVFNVRRDWIAPFSLSVIAISDCQLGPAFPSWVRTQIHVDTLILSNVDISNEIPDWFWRSLSPRLLWLDLSNNQLRGKLLRSINIHDVEYIDLSSNHLEGSIPLWKNVTMLSLRNNSLSGAIPFNIGHEMSMLEYLDLSRNSVTGSIPASMGEMRNLRFLDLSHNYISGEIPLTWHNLEKVRYVDLSSNNLSGGIPSSICSLPGLFLLKLSNNNLSEELSVSLQDCKGLHYLDLGENKFFGTIQPIVENLFNLSYLGLRANRLTGNIPEQLCRFPDLHILDLAHNNLSGYIPKCLGNLEALKFTGTIDESPRSIRQSSFSEHVAVIWKGRENEYTSTIPLLKVIDLSSNNLSGEIPEVITNLSALNSLNLSWNKLRGKIPENIQSLQQLEILDLSCNHLSGSIPPSMSSMTFLDHLNLSYNNLSGPIPTTNQFQTFNDLSIYEGNPYLCGPPLTTNCSSGPGETKDKNEEVEEVEDGSEKFWLYVGMALGFIVGFWAVCGTLIIKRSWRHAYFGLVEETKEKLLMVIAVYMARFQRKVARQMLEDTNVPQRE